MTTTTAAPADHEATAALALVGAVVRARSPKGRLGLLEVTDAHDGMLTGLIPYASTYEPGGQYEASYRGWTSRHVSTVVEVVRLSPADRAARWVVIEREHGPALAVGPYATEPDAVHAMTNALLIDGFCYDDCLDCYTAPGDALPAAADVVRIDPDDPDHTAANVARSEPRLTEPGDAAGPEAWDTYAGELDAAGRHDDANTARERANALVTITDPAPTGGEPAPADLAPGCTCGACDPACRYRLAAPCCGACMAAPHPIPA